MHRHYASPHGFQETSCAIEFGVSIRLHKYTYIYIYAIIVARFHSDQRSATRVMSASNVKIIWLACFRLVLRSKRNVALFSNFAWRTDMRGERWGGQGQASQTEIYYRIVHFYGFKCFRLVLKSEGDAGLFSNYVWQTDMRGGGRAARASLARRKCIIGRKYIIGLFIFMVSNAFD